MSGTPQLTAAQAIAILDRHWGITADRVVDLGSYEDQNLRVDAGVERYVLKVAGPSDARPPLEAEHDALAAAATLELATPVPLPARDGSEIVDVDGHRVRLLSWVEGLPLTEVAHLDEPTLRALGAVAAASSAALAQVSPARPAVASKWDPRRAPEVVDDVLADDPGLTDDERELLLAAVAPLRELLQRGDARAAAAADDPRRRDRLQRVGHRRCARSRADQRPDRLRRQHLHVADRRPRQRMRGGRLP